MQTRDSWLAWPMAGDGDDNKDKDEAKEREERVKRLQAEAKELGLAALPQQRIDELIDEGYKKGAKNSADAKKLADLEREVEALRKLKERADAKPGGGDDKVDDGLEARIAQLTESYDAKLAALTEKAEKAEAERRTEAERHRMERLRARVAAQAGGKDGNAVAPDEVFTLMQSANLFKWDDDGNDWMLVNEKGQIRIDADRGGQNMTVEAGVLEFLEKRPHLRRASGRAGSGQVDGQTTSDRESPAVPKGLEGDSVRASDVFKHRHELLRHVQAGGRIGRVGDHNVTQ